ncbi:hypothetical protein HYH03_017854 [Edaphochlamys debaryana]|uniref:AB hydrolase-1 domain-containing protein n=1 Tax=Edaphochlamys debaryana TaxID=47281 RepID=A0A835XGF5_9CHLO|nr:hypothetical protein HYH03_017854 [Edaphochlamys debaryana]|eukprot:KAG2483256.1 hypothetical protein HYH03_017854 [Edaphochlamys debaryana]
MTPLSVGTAAPGSGPPRRASSHRSPSAPALHALDPGGSCAASDRDGRGNVANAFAAAASDASDVARDISAARGVDDGGGNPSSVFGNAKFRSYGEDFRPQTVLQTAPADPVASLAQLPPGYNRRALVLGVRALAAVAAALALAAAVGWRLAAAVGGWHLLVLTAAAEAGFLLFYRRRYAALNEQPARHAPSNHDALTAFNRLLQVCQFFSDKIDARVYLSTWFCGADYRLIRRGNVADLIAYGFWYMSRSDMEAAGQGPLLARCVAALECSFRIALPPGHQPGLRCMFHLWEPLRTIYRPLTFYLAMEGLALLNKVILLALGCSLHIDPASGMLVATAGLRPPRGAAKQQLQQQPTPTGGVATTTHTTVRRVSDKAGEQEPAPPTPSAARQLRRREQQGRKAAAAVSDTSFGPDLLAPAPDTSGAGDEAVPLVFACPSRYGSCSSSVSDCSAGPASGSAAPSSDGGSGSGAHTPARPSHDSHRSRSGSGSSGGGADQGQGRVPVGVHQPEPQEEKASEASGEEGPAPVLLLHGVGVGLLPYTNLIRCLLASGLPLVAVEYKHVSMRLCSIIPTADQVAHSAVALLDRLGVGQAAVVAHSYGTFVASRLAQLHPGRLQSLALLDPVCFGMFMPHLLANFIYRKPRTSSVGLYLKDWLFSFVSRDLHCAAALCRRFYWSDVNLWPQDIPGRTLVAIGGKDQLIHVEEVLDFIQHYAAKILYHPTHSHAQLLTDASWQQQIVADIASMASAGCGRAGAREVQRRLTALPLEAEAGAGVTAAAVDAASVAAGRDAAAAVPCMELAPGIIRRLSTVSRLQPLQQQQQLGAGAEEEGGEGGFDAAAFAAALRSDMAQRRSHTAAAPDASAAETTAAEDAEPPRPAGTPPLAAATQPPPPSEGEWASPRRPGTLRAAVVTEPPSLGPLPQLSAQAPSSPFAAASRAGAGAGARAGAVPRRMTAAAALQRPSDTERLQQQLLMELSAFQPLNHAIMLGGGGGGGGGSKAKGSVGPSRGPGGSLPLGTPLPLPLTTIRESPLGSAAATPNTTQPGHLGQPQGGLQGVLQDAGWHGEWGPCALVAQGYGGGGWPAEAGMRMRRTLTT